MKTVKLIKEIKSRPLAYRAWTVILCLTRSLVASISLLRHGNLYVVTNGEYSDFSVSAVFRNRKLADDYALYLKKVPYTYNVSVEVFKANDGPKVRGIE